MILRRSVKAKPLSVFLATIASCEEHSKLLGKSSKAVTRRLVEEYFIKKRMIPTQIMDEREDNSSGSSTSSESLTDALDHQPASLVGLPAEVITKIFSYCDGPSLENLSFASPLLASVMDEAMQQKMALKLPLLPPEILSHIFAMLDKATLGKIAQVRNLPCS